ncbi:hypothetical protein [Streptomyces sp. NPDC017993]|uniref:hypothetical protein n=1 Tax=Streptomyces sp. NPDC017993 TaxID=3365027 RepID=UPI0037BB91F4
MSDPGNPALRNDSNQPQLRGLPDGEAEIRLVLRLQWEDVAALGQAAGRLAAQLQRPVTLDEAASHRLRTRPQAAHAKTAAPQTSAPQEGRPLPAVAPSGGTPLTSRSPGEQARQAIEKINGTAGS